MHLIFFTDARKEGVVEDSVHDIEEGVKHPRLRAIGQLLLYKKWHKLVLVG